MNALKRCLDCISHILPRDECYYSNRCLRDPAPATDWRDEQKVWLWKNGDHFLAYAHEYPCYPNGGDPLTIGEPVGVAILKPSAPPSTSDGDK